MNESKELRRGRWLVIGGGVILGLVVAVGVCEALGWPFLVGPMQRWLGKTLERRVSFAPDANTPPSVRIGLIGSVRLDAAYLEIGAPAWSTDAHMLLVRDARLRLGYWDLWRAYKGGALRVRELEAGVLDGQLERTADGKASWQFGPAPTSDAASQPAKIPTFGTLQVGQGTLSYRDAPLRMNLDADFSLLERDGLKGAAGAASASALPSPSPAASAVAGAVPPGLQFHGKGDYLKLPFKIDVETTGVLPIVAEGAKQIALPVTLDAIVGRARMSFRGTATDAIHLGGLKGTFSIQGPSLAAMGDPLRVTLPTTGPFDARGQVAKTGLVWNVVVNGMAVGTSHLNGAFTYDPRPSTPLLSGRLGGSRLALADLGPAVGAPARSASAAPPVKGGPLKTTDRASGIRIGDATKADAEKAEADRADAKKADARKVGVKKSAATSRGDKVLPDREFDLPSLRAMNANVLIDFAAADLGSAVLEPLTPLRTHLVLQDGVLSLNDIDARTGQGRLGGSLRLDGRGASALWNADLRLDDVLLQRFIHQERGGGQPPYLTGKLDGRIRLEGEGKSTATILGSLKGGVRFNVVDGSVSHLGIEAAGLDVAQSIGVLFKGDNALPMKCAVADLIADKGTLRPRVMVVDTTDSVVWVDGSLSLASEGLDLRLLVSPKDFSPLALRTPIHVKGTFGDPSVSIEMGKLGGRVGAAALLALVTPVAAIIPFFDTGSRDDAKRGEASCQALLDRIKVSPGLAAPGLATPLSVGGAGHRNALEVSSASTHGKPTGVPTSVLRAGPPSAR